MGRYAQARRRGTARPPFGGEIPWASLVASATGGGTVHVAWSIDVVPLDVVLELRQAVTHTLLQGPFHEGPIAVGADDFFAVSVGMSVYVLATATAIGFSPTPRESNVVVVT